MVRILTKLLPFIPMLAEKFSTQDKDLKTQREIEELRAFQNGRITPRYLFKYILLCGFAFFLTLYICALFFPGRVNMPDFNIIETILSYADKLGF